MKTGTIYIIINTLNNKKYVGQTILPIKTRWNSHVNGALRKKSSSYNTSIARAIRKYSKESFTIEVIVTKVPLIFLNSFEKYWINFYNTYKDGYNQTLGGEGTRGKSPWNKGKTNCYSKSTLDLMREKKLGSKPTNLAQLRQLSKERIGLSHQNSKLATIYDYKTNRLLFKDVSISQWCKENNHNQGNLAATARGTRKSSNGLYAVYTTKEEPLQC